MLNKKYTIKVHGCDDSTYVDMTLDEQELKVLKKLARKINKTSSNQCMPTMDICLGDKVLVEKEYK